MSILKAVVLDWAGTVVDFGSRAPMGAFVEVFRQFGVEITVPEARGPMGMAKWDHIRALGSLPRIAEAWRAAHGRDFSDADADAIHDVFVPLNARVVVDFAQLIPGAAQAVATLRARGLKIGSTTGYTREIMAPLLPAAAAQGYAPDNLVCAGDLPQGRPSPLMMYRCFLDLNVWPASAVVKVDDTPPGIGEGINAGSWTVGVTLTGNEVGLSEAELAAVSAAERAALHEGAAAKLRATGAHYIIEGLHELPAVIDQIEARMARGDRP
ncbi:phosphonoacetaldehyde hydrolase [Rhodovarius lipocyclicus]|uniref:phosphonoacetaldehyde hydrolase n=1 Tax=Rhodovarius lipocyclicus TaxID=268410 RepID=UPI00135BB5A8|nr:phosphonoacetaldehyde hydrolase [Rhodovarius lipocyclicus]